MASLPSRAHRARLGRRLAVLTGVTRRKVAERQTVRENAAALASIRAALVASGLDPEQNSAVRHFAGADRALARIADTPQLQRADAAFAADDPRLAARESLAARAAARAPRFAGGVPPDPGNSPVDWYAWSLTVERERPSLAAPLRPDPFPKG